MEFHALGPLAVYRDGEPVDLGSRKQKAVLALLLINANQPVSVDRILDELWGDESDGKGNALHVYVSRLRAALDPDRVRGETSILETRGSGYQLTVDADNVDAIRFEREATRGQELLKTDPAGAAEALKSALSLWKGPAYDDFAYDDFAHRARTRLSEARIAAFEDRIEADLAVGLSGELVSELEGLRDEHPFRERLVSHQALALYRSGRPAAALRAIDRFRRHVGEELGIDPSPGLLRLEEQVLLHDPSIQPRTSRSDGSILSKTEAINPFKGLRSFGTADAASFFGRDALVAELLRTLGDGQRLVALVGASGSGKSSVIRAGLIPALAKGAIEGSDDWLITNMMPGAHPFAELEGALLRTVIDAPDSLHEQLHDGDVGLLRAVLRILPDHDSRLLLVIDQFEELFTMVDDEAVQERFLANLVTAIDDPHDRVTVLVTLRADFYSQPLQHPEFGARLGTGIVNVTTLTAEELEAAALKPAEHAGVAFEPALLGQLISDVGNQAGALPLFQYALTELFDRRASDTLLAATYRSMGGIEGALQRRASDLFSQLKPEQKEAARQLFLRLVSVTEHDRRSRRRVAAREVASLAVDTVTMQEVIGRFGDNRLLSFDSNPLTGAPTVEVAHEALLTAWPALERWIDESRDDLRRHGALAMALREWELADHDPGYLLTSARLAEYDDWSRSSRMSLNSSERDFVDACSARIKEERAVEQRRLQEDARARRRLWTLVAALAGSLGIAALFLFGFFAGGEGPTVAFFGIRTDNGWNAGIASGLDRADRDLNMVLVDVPWVVDPGAEFRELAESGPKIIISDGFGVTSDPAVLRDFPNVRFGIVDDPVNGSNATTVLFSNEEGAFLAGVAAALKTETGIVGFIGGTPIPVIEEFRAGFEAGVRSVDAEATVLAVFVDQFGDINGFVRSDVGEARATALYQRGADVVFAAAGFSGFGVFAAAVAQSEVTDRHLWAIGVDNDQWFNVTPEEQPHVLTSIIKRGDIASYRLIEHMLNGGPAGVVARLGLADGAFDYSTQSDGMTADMVARLDQAVVEISEGRIDVPPVASGPILTLDLAGNDVVDREPVPEMDAPIGVDGFAQFAPIDPGTYEVNALGTPFTVSLTGDWWVQPNIAGHTVFTHPDSGHGSDRGVVFLRPTFLADPSQPQAAVDTQVPWPLDDIEGWLANLVDGIVTAGPERSKIGGRNAVYFEAEVTDRGVCGPFPHCAGFIVNTLLEDGAVISGWSFEHGFHQRVWWIDGGDEPPLAIIASTRSNERSFQTRADDLLDSLIIGEPRPHPVPANS